MSSSSSAPCAACKYLRRKCNPTCIFAPYFPPDQTAKFANIHQVFGASNVTKILSDLPASQREGAVHSLSYEANARILCPEVGCVAAIYDLQRRIKEMQTKMAEAKTELSAYVGDSAFDQITSPYVTRFTTVGSFQVDPSQPQIVIKEEDNQPQDDVHETMMGTVVDAVPDELGLGADDGFCIRSPNELQIQMPPEFVHQNFYVQQHDGASG